MENVRFLRLIYTFFLGLLIATFVGVGINTFYAPPAEPKFPTELNTYGKELTTEQAAKQRAFDIQNEQYREKLKPHNRNASLMSLAIAILFLAASMLSQKRLKLLADGIMLGGLLTLFYGIGRGFASQNSKYEFVVVTIGLIMVLYLGYHRFVRGRDIGLQSATRS